MKTTPPKPEKEKISQYALLERQGYYKRRGNRIISFQVDDVELKKRIAAVAKRENRSTNSWMQEHILPHMHALVASMEAKLNR